LAEPQIKEIISAVILVITINLVIKAQQCEQESWVRAGGEAQAGECLLSKCLKRSSVQPGAVAHACSPSYSGGRDKEDQALKPAWANSS
jgi:hypothetical protein